MKDYKSSDIFKLYQSIYECININNDNIDLLQRLEKEKRSYYTALIQENEKQCKKTIDEYEGAILRLNKYKEMSIEHCMSVKEAVDAKEYNVSILANLAVRINGNSKDDHYAYELYSEATAQLLGINKEIEGRCEKNKVQIYIAEQKLKEESEKIHKEIDDFKEQNYMLLASEIGQKFLNLLDEIYCSFDSENIVNEPYKNSVLIGNIQLPLKILSDAKWELSARWKKYINVQNGTIMLPFLIDLTEQYGISVEYDDANEIETVCGIKNYVANILKKATNRYSQIVWVDPIHYNAEWLFSLKKMAEGYDSIIDKIPSSNAEVGKKLASLLSLLTREEQEDKATVNRLLVLYDYPRGYDSSMHAIVRQLVANKKRYHIDIIVAGAYSLQSRVENDVVSYVRNSCIRLQVNTEKEVTLELGAEKYIFLWNTKEVLLSEEIWNRLLENKQITKTNEYEKLMSVDKCPNYQKGNRQIVNIPYAIDDSGKLLCLDFENENFATFICGAARSGKSNLLHTLITGIVKEKHPDDVEIWLIDFKMTEFSKYIDHRPPHVRYIILDQSPELVYDIIDRLTEIMSKRQRAFLGKWDKLSQVPEDRYMPALVVIIDEFPVMSQIIRDSVENSDENYMIKLQFLLQEGAAFGMHFIFSSQGFTSGAAGLNEFAKKQIQQRLSMKIDYDEIRATLDLKSISDADKSLMEEVALTPRYVLKKIMQDEQGNHLQKGLVLHIKEKLKQEIFMDEIRKYIQPVDYFAFDEKDKYVDKQAMILNGNSYRSFNDVIEIIKKTLKKEITDKQEKYLFIGEPCRMREVYPIHIQDNISENLLLIGPPVERDCVLSIIASVVTSISLQEGEILIWSRESDGYKGKIREALSQVKIKQVDSLANICQEIGEMKEQVRTRRGGDKFIFILGMDTLLQEMEYADSESSKSENKQGFAFGRGRESGVDILSMMKSGKTREEILKEFKTGKNEFADLTSEHSTCSEYDAREDLRYIITHGPRYGFHFVILLNSIRDIKQYRLDMGLFKHKVTFRMSKNDANELVGARIARYMAEIPTHSFRYTNGIESVLFRPFLHEGLAWDGWKMLEGKVHHELESSEELLM